MKKSLFTTLPAVALVCGLALMTNARAEGDTYATPGAPGVSGESGSAGTGMGASSSGSKDMAKVSLAPHTVVIQSSLQSALDQLQGLRAQLQVAQSPQAGQAAAGYSKHYKSFKKEINSDLSMVRTHEKELAASAKKHPEIAQSDDFKKASDSISQVNSVNSSWQKQAESSSYWKNPQQAMTDLDKLQSQLKDAVSSVKSLNSSLDISIPS